MLITLNRPSVRNAIDDALVAGLIAATDLLLADETIRVAVLEGAGTGFCAGMDLRHYRATGRVPTGLRSYLRAEVSKPVIAAVEGFAYGAGLEIALSADVMVVGESARLCLPEVGVGLIAAGGGLTRLADRLPLGDAMAMVLTGDPITGAQAYARGLAARCTQDGDATSAALAIAERVGANHADAVRTSKRVLLEARGRTEAERWAIQDTHLSRFFGTSASRELTRDVVSDISG
ncbi:MAG: enoyl-CoA hydratase [Pseudonocardiales bacterium]|nr:enoyl-CoA hydratase [Pseudonocardiales bacterium]